MIQFKTYIIHTKHLSKPIDSSQAYILAATVIPKFIPLEYINFTNIFSKQKTQTLLKHGLQDLAVKTIFRSIVLFDLLYNLFTLELKDF